MLGELWSLEPEEAVDNIEGEPEGVVNEEELLPVEFTRDTIADELSLSTVNIEPTEFHRLNGAISFTVRNFSLITKNYLEGNS